MPDAAVRRPVVFAGSSWLSPQPVLTRFLFRGDDAARAAAGTAFGVALPEEPCRAVSRGTRAALWLGPDEHLLLAPGDEASAIETDLSAALITHQHALVDVSHRQVAFLVRGPHAAWLLESQCPLPLNTRDFPVGMCTRTVFAKAEIVLWRTGADAFHVEVWRSFAQYLVGMLQQVARELGDA